MRSTLTAIIDANVFFGARLTSLVLFVAQTGMVRARWTAKIHAEWMRNVHEKRDIPYDELELRRTYIDNSILDCLVTGYEDLENTFGLPDSSDEHVLAAAVSADADVIVTHNVRDFPPAILSPLGIEARHPDAFLLDMSALSADAFAEAVREDFEHYTSPALTFERYVADLIRAGVPETARTITNLRILIDPASER